jgi:transposase-like protein
MAVERMETCDDVGELARELGVRPRCLYKWRKKLESIEPGQEASRPSTHASAHHKEIHGLKQLLAEKILELDFFKGALQKVSSTPEMRRNWRDGIYEQIREVIFLQGSLSIERMCQLASVSRRSFYRSLKERQPTEEEIEVRSAIQTIAVEHRQRYGYRLVGDRGSGMFPDVHRAPFGGAILR